MENDSALTEVNTDADQISHENEEGLNEDDSEMLKKNDAEGGNDQDQKLSQLPITRIRGLMKLDPDFQVASAEAVLALTRATEMFIESLARESFAYTTQSKKKTIQKHDVELAISAVDSLMFLDGALNI